MLIPTGGSVADRVDVHELRLRPGDRRPDRRVRRIRARRSRASRRGLAKIESGAGERPAASSRTTRRSSQVHQYDSAALNNDEYIRGVAAKVLREHSQPSARMDASSTGTAGDAVPPARARDSLARGCSSWSRSASSATSRCSRARSRTGRVHWAFSNFCGRDLRVPHAVRALVRLRRDRDDRVRSCSRIRSCTGSRSGRAVAERLPRPHRRAVLRHVPRPDARVAQHPRRRGAGRRLPARHPRPRRRTAACSRRPSQSSRASPTTSSPSWPCRSTSRWSRSTRGSSRRRRTCTRRRTQAFLRVTLPLSAPGIVAGTLLTFIPAAGDFINAQLLGTPTPVHDRERHPVEVPRVTRLSDGGVALVPPHGAHPRRPARLRPRGRNGAADRDEVRTSARAHASTRSSRSCYLLLPVAVVILFSFNAPSGRYNYVWQGFTFDNWVNWNSVPGIQDAVWNVARGRTHLARSSRPCSARCSRSRSSATASAGEARRTCSSSCRWRRRRSSSARRFSRCS